jgi:hypothetical protein
MPRNPGTGQYSKPIPDAIPNTTIASAPYNSNVNDVVIDLNSPRPIVAGGTGATSATEALNNLNGEHAKQPVTNYDSTPFYPGSFYSENAATAAPNTSAFVGGVWMHSNTQYAVIEAYDVLDSVPTRKWVRRYQAGVWGAWTLADAAITTSLAAKVSKAGDTMTGNLQIDGTNPALILNKTGTFVANDIWGKTNGVTRWLMRLGDTSAEGGGNSGSGFAIIRANDAGTTIDAPISINRVDGRVYLIGDPTQPLQAATKQYADLKVAKTGDTMTGMLVVNLGVITGWNPAINIGAPTGGQGIVVRPGSDPGMPLQLVNAANSAVVGNITTTAAATAYNTASDGRLKEDLRALSTSDASAIIDGTEVYDFKWKGSESGERAYGVIAQQAAPVYATPAFHDKETDRWFIDYSKYVPVMLRELQALRARVAQLEAGLTAKPA